MSNFWTRVRRCKHVENKTYGVFVPCSHGDLGCSGGLEWHCRKCGVYITDDPCGDVAGMSGWPHKRWKRHQKIWSNSVRWGLNPP